MDKNFEDVVSTLKEIKSKPKSKPQSIALTAVKWVFFPVTLSVMLLRYIFVKRKLRLTTKTTVIFTVIFSVLITVYLVFVLLYLHSYIKNPEIDGRVFFTSMTVTSVILIIFFIFVAALASAVTSSAMLKPIRRIITDVDSVTGDNLSFRLEEIDSQDEITELVQQINKMIASLEQAFEQQANFVADASHELKTPLSVISGYGNLLDRWGKDDPSVLSEGIEAIRRESAYMAKIIDQMLLLARLGSFTMTRQKFELTETIGQIIDSYGIIHKEPALIFTAGGAVTLETDKALLTEAVRAIIDNAIKYTPDDGEIRVFAGMENDSPIISVRDTGAGISEEDIGHIFDRFYRCDKTRGREKGSAGLGLTICKSIIEIMEGSIKVFSQKGRGTEFRITF